MYNYFFFVISFLSCFWTVVKDDCSSWGIFLSFFAPMYTSDSKKSSKLSIC